MAMKIGRDLRGMQSRDAFGEGARKRTRQSKWWLVQWLARWCLFVRRLLRYGFQARYGLQTWAKGYMSLLNGSIKVRCPARHKERFSGHFHLEKWNSSSALKLYFQGTKLESQIDWKLNHFNYDPYLKG